MLAVLFMKIFKKLVMTILSQTFILLEKTKDLASLNVCKRNTFKNKMRDPIFSGKAMKYESTFTKAKVSNRNSYR